MGISPAISSKSVDFPQPDGLQLLQIHQGKGQNECLLMPVFHHYLYGKCVKDCGRTEKVLFVAKLFIPFFARYNLTYAKEEPK